MTADRSLVITWRVTLSQLGGSPLHQQVQLLLAHVVSCCTTYMSTAMKTTAWPSVPPNTSMLCPRLRAIWLSSPSPFPGGPPPPPPPPGGGAASISPAACQGAGGCEPVRSYSAASVRVQSHVVRTAVRVHRNASSRRNTGSANISMAGSQRRARPAPRPGLRGSPALGLLLPSAAVSLVIVSLYYTSINPPLTVGNCPSNSQP